MLFAKIVKKIVFSKDERSREKRKANPKMAARFLDSDKHKPHYVRGHIEYNHSNILPKM